MRQRRHLPPRALVACAALLIAAALCACAGVPSRQQSENDSLSSASPQPTQQVPAKQEAAPSAPQSDATTQPSPATFAPPQIPDVRSALERTYKNAVTFDERNMRAVVGDFNGDGSEDLAVVVRPVPDKLAELNDGLANWIVIDPRKVLPPDPHDFDPHEGVQKLKPPSGPTHVEAGDTLLVVIHGFKEPGWRNPEAMQTFLLRNVAGTQMSVRPRVSAQAEARKNMPRLLGDVIRERLNNESGFLYWTSAGYGWFH